MISLSLELPNQAKISTFNVQWMKISQRIAGDYIDSKTSIYRGPLAKKVNKSVFPKLKIFKVFITPAKNR